MKLKLKNIVIEHVFGTDLVIRILAPWLDARATCTSVTVRSTF